MTGQATHDPPCAELIRIQDLTAQMLDWKRSQNGDIREIRTTQDVTLRESRSTGGRAHSSGQSRWIVDTLLKIAGNGIVVGGVAYTLSRLLH